MAIGSSSSPAIFLLAVAVAVAAAPQLVSAGYGYYTMPPSTPPPSPSAGVTPYKPPTEWTLGSATFYGDQSGQGGDFGGACGYSANDIASLYSTRTAALSTPLFAGGNGCGQCYELRCVQSRWCIPGAQSVIVTGTNLCPPNWAQDSNAGGWCNPPRQHFDMTLPVFNTFAPTVAGIVPVQFRRVPCKRTGGVRFLVQGNPYWLLLYIMNVGGSGDVCTVSVKPTGGAGNYIPMSQNWGVTYQSFFAHDNTRGLTVQITTCSSPAQTIVVGDAIGPWWTTGLSYQGSKNFY